MGKAAVPSEILVDDPQAEARKGGGPKRWLNSRADLGKYQVGQKWKLGQRRKRWRGAALGRRVTELLEMTCQAGFHGGLILVGIALTFTKGAVNNETVT